MRPDSDGCSLVLRLIADEVGALLWVDMAHFAGLVAAGDVDVYVDYGGTLWTNVLARTDIPPAPALRAELQDTLAVLDYKKSKIKEEECQKSDQIEQKRLAFARDSIEPQVASKQAAVDQAKQLAKLKMDQVEALHLRAGMSGVLQQLPVQIGQRVKIGDNLARVADPTKLKAQVKIAETQAAGVIALMLEANPSLKPAMVKALGKANTNGNEMGFGRQLRNLNA